MQELKTREEELALEPVAGVGTAGFWTVRCL